LWLLWHALSSDVSIRKQSQAVRPGRLSPHRGSDSQGAHAAGRHGSLAHAAGNFAFGYGTTELGVTTPPRADTYFTIASHIKTMTAP
jgi:hypothetical protein